MQNYVLLDMKQFVRFNTEKMIRLITNSQLHIVGKDREGPLRYHLWFMFLN